MDDRFTTTIERMITALIVALVVLMCSYAVIPSERCPYGTTTLEYRADDGQLRTMEVCDYSVYVRD